MSYVDGFVLVIPKDKVEDYKKMASEAMGFWKEYGALDYKECQADDMNADFGVPFPKLANAKDDEVVFFSYIVYRDRAHRDEVNKKVMSDERLSESCKKYGEVFDMKRMAYGGFQTVVGF